MSNAAASTADAVDARDNVGQSNSRTASPKSSMSFRNRDVRTYVASAIFLVLVIGLMVFLTFVTIPSGNKDLIVAIISMLVGGTGVAMGKLFGEGDTEKEKLQARLAAQDLQIAALQAQYSVLKGEYDGIVAMLVRRHIVDGEGIKV